MVETVLGSAATHTFGLKLAVMQLKMEQSLQHMQDFKMLTTRTEQVTLRYNISHKVTLRCQNAE